MQWNIDPTHTEIGFSVRHLGISNVRGRFQKFSGTVETDGAGAPTAVSLSIEMVGLFALWTTLWQLITNIPWSSLVVNPFSLPSDLTSRNFPPFLPLIPRCSCGVAFLYTPPDT